MLQIEGIALQNDELYPTIISNRRARERERGKRETVHNHEHIGVNSQKFATVKFMGRHPAVSGVALINLNASQSRARDKPYLGNAARPLCIAVHLSQPLFSLASIVANRSHPLHTRALYDVLFRRPFASSFVRVSASRMWATCQTISESETFRGAS